MYYLKSIAHRHLKHRGQVYATKGEGSMFKRLRKAAAVICAAAMVLSMTACGSAGDKKVVLHFTHTQSPGSISDLTAQEFKRLVEERSAGRIEVNIYSNCGLSGGDLTKAIELVQAGNIDIHSCAPPNIANYDKKFYSFWLPFLFPNSDDLLAFCHSDKVHEVVNGWCNDLEMEMLGINNAGSRQISNSKKEITKPEDLKGMNIRVPGANIFIGLYRNYFGANPTAMDFSEVYTSLQQKTIDGQENPIAVFDSSKFAEVQQYVTLWDGVRDTTIWVMSRKTMDRLSPEDQDLVKECAAEALDWGNEYLADNEAVIIQKLKDGGTVITELTEEQKAEFQKACTGIYDDYAKSVGQDVIDLFTGGYKN